MTARRKTLLMVVAALLGAAYAGPVLATGGGGPSGRFSLFGSWASRRYLDSGSSDLTELITTMSLHSGSDDNGLEWAVDGRVATFPSSDREQRISLYEAWAGWRSPSGLLHLRAGQLWINELGALGSLGGAQVELRFHGRSRSSAWRTGVFAGLEPEIADAGYTPDVKKGGAYLALDGTGGRRHVLGWIGIQHGGLTERSVLVFNNFVPVDRRLFVYQALELDTQGPGGVGGSRLSYLFVNVRYAVSHYVEVQGTYHRGQSVDVRTITQDLLDERPVDPRLLDGILFESALVRVTVRPVRGLITWVSRGRDTNNRGEPARDRLGLGISANNVMGSGIDLTVSNTNVQFGGDSYNSLYVSLGATIGRRTYLTLDYTKSLSVFHRIGADGGLIEVRPDSTRTALSANLNLNRTLSVLLSLEYYNNPGFDETRGLIGLGVRF